MPATLPLHRHQIPASPLALGCMGLGGDWDASSAITSDHLRQAQAAVEAALEIGINFFDHADIYTRGKAETVFGRVLQARPDLRPHIFIQTKCGIRFQEGDVPGRYDFSHDHIVRSVEGSLTRLAIDYLDVLLLHRPDPLMEPDEVAQAFDELHAAGKVRSFGVSNMNAAQMAFLQHSLDQPLVVNQLELSLAHLGFLDAGVHVNQDAAREDQFPQGTVEYCQTHAVQIQAWGPLAQGLFSGRPLDRAPENVRATAERVAALARTHSTTAEAIALAFLLRHPAGIQPVVGSTVPGRIQACKDAPTVHLSREEWYALYVAARGKALP